MKTDIWFALVQVEPMNGNRDLGEAEGAFVNVAFQAKTRDEFVKGIFSSFREYDFNVLTIDDIERIGKIKIDNANNSEKLLMVEKIDNGSSLEWGEFHTY